MPVQTGVVLLDRAKRRYPHIVRVLTTAYADLEDAVAAVNSGEIHRYVLKPWDIAALRADLRAAMEVHRRRCHEQELFQAKRRTMMALAAHVAHEVSTPLVTIRMLAASLEEQMPALRQALCRVPSRSPTDALCEPEVLELLEVAPARIRSAAERASLLMQLMLVNAREEAVDTRDYRVFSMARCVQDALGSYCFAEGERDLVGLSGDDFDVWGSDLLMTFVIYNLLKNALYAVRAARKGGVTICIEPGSPFNRLYVRDTGEGIPVDTLPRIFEEFFTGTGSRGGTGMGLPFCRRVMTAFGGTIACRSREGEHTELELCFPHPKGQADAGVRREGPA
jgi:two-component system response regulator PhcR